MTRSLLSQTQFSLTDYLRDPDNVAAPDGVEQRRLDVYSELIFNNIEGFLSSGFPILRSITNDDIWLRLVRMFVAQYRAHSPYFLEIGKEFLTFVQNSASAQALLPVFASELMHYEWVELALDVSPDELPDSQSAKSVSLACRVHLSDLAWPLAYQYPVHTIGPNNQPSELPSQPTFLLVHRDRSHKVKFTALNGLSYALLEAVDAVGGRDLGDVIVQLRNLVQGHQTPLPELFEEQALAMVQRFVDQDILLIC